MPFTPKAETKTFYDFSEMIEHVNKVLGYDQRQAGKHYFPHLFPEISDFDSWCNSKGYGEKDPSGKGRGSSQIWFAEYNKDMASGEWKTPEKAPDMDFWTLQYEKCVGEDFQNDSYSTVDIGLECYGMREAEQWQKDIQKVWYKEFKHIAVNDGLVYIWVSW